MKKLVSTMLTAGAMAGLMAMVMPPSSARAQTSAAPDKALLIIRCSINAEESAVKCKEGALEELEKCLKEADGRPVPTRRCDADALAALTKCQLSGILADAKCWVNPAPPVKEAE